MYNLSQRANTAFSLATSVLFTILGIVAAISFVTGYGSPSSAKVQVKNIRVVQSRYGPDYFDYGRKTSEFGMIKFDLDADLSDLFNWNTKQLFVSVVAEYETKTHNKNQVVIWDKIIRNKESAKLSLRNVPNKYALIDFGQKWRKQQARLSLHWDVTPWVGTFQMGSSNTSAAVFTFPQVENQSGR
ncbi:Signal peptidase complex subunit 3 [Umbelopsis sp. WA50703]